MQKFNSFDSTEGASFSNCQIIFIFATFGWLWASQRSHRFNACISRHSKTTDHIMLVWRKAQDHTDGTHIKSEWYSNRLRDTDRSQAPFNCCYCSNACIPLVNKHQRNMKLSCRNQEVLYAFENLLQFLTPIRRCRCTAVVAENRKTKQHFQNASQLQKFHYGFSK